MTQPAPYFADLADGPADGAAHWLTASDGVRIRVGSWNHGAAAGTVLLFPGRSEYVEKYGRAATDLAARGFATITVDWRGQGLADRLNPNAALGHVDRFRDYQADVAALLDHARWLGLPHPFYLLGHSMGGCIGLRALHDGLPVAAVGFTAPMWGIQMAAAIRPVARTLSSVARPLRFGHVFAPGQVSEPYVMRVTFEENHLTGDPEMFEWMRAHLTAKPELGLGGPSLNWLNEALVEMRDLGRLPAPDLPCLTYVGGREAIVDPDKIRALVARWPGARLEEVADAFHEIMMDRPEFRTRLFDDLAGHFRAGGPRSVAI